MLNHYQAKIDLGISKLWRHCYKVLEHRERRLFLPAISKSSCRRLESLLFINEANNEYGSRLLSLIDAQNRPWLLEINTLPGFTPKSLLPEAAKQAGIDLGPLVDRLARRAYGRGKRSGQ
jgi:hypothetical protein